MFGKKFYEDTDFNACRILKVLRNTAEYYPNCSSLSEVMYHAFNEDYNYIYYKDAERALQNAGVFDCFQAVHNYLMKIDGEDKTDYTNPVDIANLLFCIQGERITQAVAEWLGVGIDDDLNPEEWHDLLNVSIKNIAPFLDDFNSFKEQE